MKNTLVVIGANSFSGQDFVDTVLEKTDYEVIGISRSPERSRTFLKYKSRSDLSRYSYYALDLNHDLEKIIEIMDLKRPAMIVNFAAQSEVAPSWLYPEHWYETNCVSLAALLKNLAKRDYIEKYLHISSPEVYGSCSGVIKEDAPFNPSTPYAASKAAADLLLSVYQKQFNFPLITVRATNVYGARQQLFKIIPRSVIYLKIGKQIELHGGGLAKKSYINIRDVSEGELAILQRGRVGEIYHLSPADGISVRDVVQTICRLSGKRFEDAVKQVEERPGQDAAYIIDSSKARNELGWKPHISLDQGLNEVVEWVEENWQEISSCSLDYLHKE